LCVFVPSVLDAPAHGRRESDGVGVDVDLLVEEPLVDAAERPTLAPKAFDDVDDRVVPVRGGCGHGLRLGEKIVHFDLLDCLTVESAKKSSMTFSTCGEKRRRSDFASAASLKARLRGNEMVFLTVGSAGIVCKQVTINSSSV
jgi:hypothetical protein